MEIDASKRSLLKKYLRQKLEEINNSKVVLVTPYKIDNNSGRAIVDSISDIAGKEIEGRVDRSLIGGFVIIYGTKIIDASIRNKLSNIKKSLIN